MTILETLKSELIAARKARDPYKVTFLSTIIGELEGEAKKQKTIDAQIVTDETAVKYFKKYIQTNLDNIQYAKTAEEEYQLTTENQYLAQFVPSELTENQISDILIVGEFPNIGQFMAHMKQHYAGRYDGKLATNLFKEFQGEGRNR